MTTTCPTKEGKILRTFYCLADRTCAAEPEPAPMQIICDIMTPATYGLVLQAETYPWLPADAVLGQKLSYCLAYQNQCVSSHGKIYVWDGEYVDLEVIILRSALDAKKVIITRIAEQIACCNTLLSAEKYRNPGDRLSDTTAATLAVFMSKCAEAQHRYQESKVNHAAELCVWKNGNVCIRSDGVYKILPEVIRHMSNSKAEEMLRELAQIAAELHSIITGEDIAT